MIELLQQWAKQKPEECSVTQVGDRPNCHRLTLSVDGTIRTSLLKGGVTGASEVLVRMVVEEAIAHHVQTNKLGGWGLQSYSWGQTTAYSILGGGEIGVVAVGGGSTEALLKLYLELIKQQVEVAA